MCVCPLSLRPYRPQGVRAVPPGPRRAHFPTTRRKGSEKVPSSPAYRPGVELNDSVSASMDTNGALTISSTDWSQHPPAEKADGVPEIILYWKHSTVGPPPFPPHPQTGPGPRALSIGAGDFKKVSPEKPISWTGCVVRQRLSRLRLRASVALWGGIMAKGSPVLLCKRKSRSQSRCGELIPRLAASAASPSPRGGRTRLRRPAKLCRRASVCVGETGALNGRPVTRLTLRRSGLFRAAGLVILSQEEEPILYIHFMK